VRGIACDEGFLRLQFYLSYIIGDGIICGGPTISRPGGDGIDGAAGKAKSYDER